jgi:type IV secretion system protein VirB8
MATFKKKNKKEPKVQVRSWYSNRYQIVVVQRNILLILTACSIISVSVAVLFVKKIIASKSLDPYVIELEQKTGVATIVDNETATRFTGNDAVKRYFIQKFLDAALAYDPRTYKDNVEEVRLFSVPKVYADFKSRINPRQLGVGGKIDVRIKSMRYIDSSNLRLRILRSIKVNENSPIIKKDEIVTMTFYFAPNISLTMEERMVNPLGFQVSKLLIEEEIFSY